MLLALTTACADSGGEADSVQVGGDAPPRVAATSRPLLARPFEIMVDGVPASGLIARPRGPASRLVVVGHGMGHTAESWRTHLELIASHGAIAVAPDYAPYFDLDRGGQELVGVAVAGVPPQSSSM